VKSKYPESEIVLVCFACVYVGEICTPLTGRLFLSIGEVRCHGEEYGGRLKRLGEKIKGLKSHLVEIS
jgi:hypothetical protein